MFKIKGEKYLLGFMIPIWIGYLIAYKTSELLAVYMKSLDESSRSLLVVLVTAFSWLVFRAICFCVEKKYDKKIKATQTVKTKKSYKIVIFLSIVLTVIALIFAVNALKTRDSEFGVYHSPLRSIYYLFFQFFLTFYGILIYIVAWVEQRLLAKRR